MKNTNGESIRIVITEHAPKERRKVKELKYGFEETTFGRVVAAQDAWGICLLDFVTGSDKESADIIAQKYPDAEMLRDDRLAKEAVRPFLNGDNFTVAEQGSFTMSLYGTPFQLAVWRALLGVECGKTVSYSQLAGAAGYPAAVRAAASAVGSNPVSLLIPCHRIIRNDGTIGKYMWGTDIKTAILRWEKEV